MVPPPTVAKPHQGLSTLTRPTSGLAAPGAMPTGPGPTTVAAGTALTLVPKAPDEFAVVKPLVDRYSYSEAHRKLSPFCVPAFGWFQHPGAFFLLYTLTLPFFLYLFNTFFLRFHYLKGAGGKSSSSIRSKVSTIAVVKIGQSVKAERVKRFWTQERLAKEAGISQKALSKIETNQVEPRFSTILKLAEAFGVDPSELVK